MRLAGYQEIEHTADWALQVWAPTLEALFAQAAMGMYALAGTRLNQGWREKRKLHLEAGDAESLLVAFLSELVFLGEQENLGFDRFEIEIEGNALRAKIEGAPMATRKKEIKAVTYHNMEIRPGTRGLEVEIVFDV